MRSAQDRRIATESAEEREARLHQLRVVQQQRITAESAEERIARLQQLRFGQPQRITAESTEERETRLQQARSAQDRRIATESAEEREARLQYVRSAQDRRIATESAEEREARLQQLRVAQQQRIATETSEEIEARRARDRRNHMDLKTAEVPLFQQTCVRFKMRQFHSRLKSVCVPRCVTKVSMHLSISHSLCSAVHNYDSLCRRSSRSPIMLSILLVLYSCECSPIIGASVSEPPLVDSTDALSRYIYNRYIYRRAYVHRYCACAALRANVAGRIGNRFSPAESAFSACIGLGSNQTS